MGAFEDVMTKMGKQDRDARYGAVNELLDRHGLKRSDLDDGYQWILSETGPFGKTVIRLYKLVEEVTVNVESKVRVQVDVKKYE